MPDPFMNIIRQTRSVAAATLRQAVHTRAAFWMFSAVIAATGILPALLRGDGAAGSSLRLAMIYPPAMLLFILFIGTVWLAAAVMALEIEHGGMSSLAVKPVHPFVIWTGKWIGVLCLNTALLTVAAAVFIPSVAAIARRENNADETSSRSGGHLVFHPDETLYRLDARQRIEAFRLTGTPEAEMSFAQMLNRIKTEAFRTGPGQTSAWTIPLPASAFRRQGAQGSAWDLQFLFRCDPLTRSEVSGTWIVSAPGEPPLTIPARSLLDGLHQLRLPPEAALHTGPVMVAFSNHADSAAVYFDPRDPVMLRRRVSGFPENLIRAFLIMFCFTAAIAALALGMGVLFSFPVAVFIVLSVFFAIMISSVFAGIPETGHVHGDAASGGLVMHAGEYLLYHLHRATAGTWRLLPLASLSNAVHIPSWRIIQAFLRLFALAPAVFAAGGVFLLRRKEYP